VPHCRINGQPFGIVGVFVSGQTTERGLTQQPNEGVLTRPIHETQSVSWTGRPSGFDSGPFGPSLRVSPEQGAKHRVEAFTPIPIGGKAVYERTGTVRE